ncbi:MAG: hemerythrin domain-containing protein [Acidimicrobiales bacterium]|nr:hemerythrin domain-containing protein [Acidimicrobiales bacterium]
MNALDLLIADHNRVRGLFTRFKDAHQQDDDTMAIELAGKIFDELQVHTTIEEEIFYPAVHDTDDEIKETVDEGVQEHHVVKVLLEELGQVAPAGDEWAAKMMVLIENVEHHAEEEEKEMFPPLRSQLDAATLDGLAEQLEQRKRDLGAPVLADKADLAKEQLLQLAKEQEIPGRSSMSHDELAATVAPA